MCGITGFWYAKSIPEETARRWLHEMSDALIHRGPDGAGVFFDRESGIGFGHRRLSILDLSSAGAQPMWSASGRYCITYNGEVYNAPEIRADLDRAGHRIPWRGHSDTEVVLEAIDALGLEGALEQFRGMFAFALWDTRARQLSLVRDRLGIKPLLYGAGPFGLIFASELQALFPFPELRPRLDRSTLAEFLRYAVVPGTQCIIEGVRKVAPGSILRFGSARDEGRESFFWSATQIAADGLARPFQGTVQDATEELERRIQTSVELRMRSDVPFGAFLSGGIDSSTVVAMMQRSTSRPVNTFTIGNTAPGYDEGPDAEAVARHLGTSHRTLVADPSDMLAIAPEVAQYWDEPFADSSQIPTLLVSRLTRQHVTVALSGDGGDELFAGYNRHLWAPILWRLGRRVPKPLRRALASLNLVSVEDWDRAFRALGLDRFLRLPGDKLHKVASISEVHSAEELYARLRSHWSDPKEVMADHTPPRSPRRPVDWSAPFAARMMLQDLLEYLPDDILTKVDRASMAVSLEARVPLLDHRVVELAWQLPLDWKIRGRDQKWILRQVLARHVPPTLFKRPKTGFGVPIGQWLRGPLRGWAVELLDERTLAADGFFDPEVVAATWKAHLEGRGNHEHRIWAALMFQSWWNAHRAHIES